MEASILVTDKSVISTIIDEELLSMEQLDRASPELWPEHIPGVNEFSNKTTYEITPMSTQEFDDNDMKFLLYLSKLSPNGVVNEVKKLYDTAYQLGIEESKEMTRGKYLKILSIKEDSSTT